MYKKTYGYMYDQGFRDGVNYEPAQPAFDDAELDDESIVDDSNFDESGFDESETEEEPYFDE